MIDDLVLQAATEFQEFFNGLLEEYPGYRFDGSWPSAGIVDCVLSPLKRAQHIDETDRAVIEGAAAYLGTIAYQIWRTYPDVGSVSLSAQAQPRVEFLLSVQGGAHLGKDERFSIALCQSLESLLLAQQEVISIFPSVPRVLRQEDNWISGFAAGVFSGLCPSGQGPWAFREVGDFIPCIDVAARELARTSASYYTRIFPLAKDLGSDAPFYYPHLVLPPGGYQEAVFGARALEQMHTMCAEQGVEKTEIHSLAMNLLKSPDDLLSAVGFAVVLALNEGEPNKTALAKSYCEAKAIFERRSLVLLAREFFGDKNTVNRLLEEGALDKASTLMSEEYQLGLLPLYFLPDFEIVKDDKLSSLLRFLLVSDVALSKDFLLTYRGALGLSTELTLQLGFIYALSGEWEGLSETLSAVSLEEGASAEVSFRYNELLGMYELNQMNMEKAQQYFEEALLAGSKDDQRFSSVVLSLVSIYVRQDELSMARTVLEQAVKRIPCHLPLRTRRLRLALHEGEVISQDKLTEMYELYPYSAELFSLIKDVSIVNYTEMVDLEVVAEPE